MCLYSPTGLELAYTHMSCPLYTIYARWETDYIAIAGQYEIHAWDQLSVETSVANIFLFQLLYHLELFTYSYVNGAFHLHQL